jgi:hypothetical protein
MANTFQDYTATAGQTDFAFTFDYLEDEHVKVFVDGVEQALTTNFTIDLTSTKKIVLSNPITPLTGGEIVRVRRISDPATDLVDFQNGSVLTESELDRAYLHNRYLAEESAEQNDISLRVKAGADGQFDALNKKIINVSEPTADQDAATKNYVDDTVAGVVGGAIPDDSVTYAKLQNAAGNNVLLGNDNGADSDLQELSAAEAKTLLGLSTVATSGSYNDLSDQPAISSGTVTSVDSGTGLTGGPITTSGTLSLASIANLRALGNVSGGSAAPVAIEIKDEDAMTSDSATALATQQSIKAYVDAQVAASTVSKYSSEWVNTDGTTSVGNGATLNFTHDLGTSEIQVEVWMATNSSGSGARKVQFAYVYINGTYGADISSVSTNSLTVQLGDDGWINWNTTGTKDEGNWGTTYTHIKVVAIG